MSRFPRSFGRYTLVSNLAQGGMGALYLACQGEPGMEKLCVIKTVLPQLADKEYVARFRDEAKVVVKLSHGNLVPVFDAGMASGLAGVEMYLAMDYVDGKDLRAVWNRCAKKGIAFPVEVAVFLALQLCRGLHHAHTFSTLKLVHRDVSPPNVLLSFFGEVKLTDFGLAASTLKTEKTAPGVVYGKVSYMSPEQARGEVLDGRTDLYAVGIILWELLTGRQLFPQSEPKLIERVRAPLVEAPSRYAPRVAPALDAIVMKALAVDQTQRYADCELLRAALAGFLAQTAPTTDSSRVAIFLKQLFDDEIEQDRQRRQQLLAEAMLFAASEGRKLPSLSQSDSQPNTVSLQPGAPGGIAKQDGILGTYIDGKYLVKRLIGEGGMGLVYEAEHVEIGRRVAIKVLHAMYTRQTEVVARFRSEARAATRIGHPHIIDVFDSGTTVEGAVYFVMEYLEGRDLAQLIEEEGPLTAERAVEIARQICQALQAAHKVSILHRDLKPENIFLIERDGDCDFVKVLDFGIAKTIDAVSERINRLTNPGVAMGTPEYMAPEQAAGQLVDPRADIYSIGAMLYEMLSGHPPHEGATVMEVLTRKATQAPASLETQRPELPRALVRLVMRCLAVAPELRPLSMEVMAAELSRVVGSPPVLAAERTERVARQRRPAVLAGALGAAALLGGTWLWSSHGRTAPAVARPAPVKRSLTPPPVAPASGAAVAGPPSVAVAAEVAPKQSTPAADPAASDPVPAARPKGPTARADARTGERGRKPASTEAELAEARRGLQEAHAAMLAERYAEAEELYDRVRVTGLERPAVLSGLAEVAFQRGSYPEAVRLAQRALGAGAGVKARMVLGNSYFKLERYDDAIAQYREVLQVDGTHLEARQNLAAAERRKGQ